MGQAKILTVDDSESVLQVVAATLRAAGHQVTTATSGNDALQKAIADPPDLLITDLNMPHMDGLTLVREVRKVPSCRHIPIVVLTTDLSDTYKREARAAGASAWMTKPFNADRLIQVISKVLRHGP